MQPTDHNLPYGIEVAEANTGRLQSSAYLSELLVNSRSNYDWPSGTGAAKSQAIVISLETRVAELQQSLDESRAHEIIVRVSEWAGNNAKAHRAILAASQNEKRKMLDSLVAFQDEALFPNAVNGLAMLSGISLVIATKIFRFCCPTVGAAVDRHASYFFNSLDIVRPNQSKVKASAFRREWATARKSTSRLATYTPSGYAWNRDQYFDRYLPFLLCISDSLNDMKVPFRCAATGKQMVWRPTDIEMAGYYWWACNGPR